MNIKRKKKKKVRIKVKTHEYIKIKNIIKPVTVAVEVEIIPSADFCITS